MKSHSNDFKCARPCTGHEAAMCHVPCTMYRSDSGYLPPGSSEFDLDITETHPTAPDCSFSDNAHRAPRTLHRTASHCITLHYTALHCNAPPTKKTYQMKRKYKIKTSTKTFRLMMQVESTRCKMPSAQQWKIGSTGGGSRRPSCSSGPRLQPGLSSGQR